MPELPVVVLVQGSFQQPAVYEQLTKSLRTLGFVTSHPRLPSCTDSDNPDFPQTTLIDDALAIRLELTRQVEYEGKTVMVAMHSYGGLVGSEAIPEDLSFAKRQSLDLPGGPDGRFDLVGAEEKLYADLPKSEAAFWASRILPSSHKVQESLLTRAAWRYIPSTYLICENDNAVPPQMQDAFAATVQAHVERCSTGHSPMLSHPAMLAEKIHEAALKAIHGPIAR
ncbi:MAG: hypothetical protein Q9183_003136 [Haloplaca sp. 2 TL-2023]